MEKIKANLSEEERNIFEIEKSISQELQLFKDFDKKNKEAKNNDIKSMIRYYINLTNDIEARRTRIHSFTLQMLAICITAIILLHTQSQKIEPILYNIVIWILYVQIIFSFFSAYIYERQSGFNYTFLNLKKYGNKWKWFYYGNKEILKINTNVMKKSKKFNETKEPYLKGFKNFIHNYRKENLYEEILNNLQQLYLLQVHNYYKNKFYLQLTKIRKYSLYSIIVIIIIGIIKGYYRPFLNFIDHILK